MPDATTTTTEQTTTAATTTAPAVTAPATEVARTEDKSLDKFPPELQQHIRELRDENKSRRLREEALAKSVQAHEAKIKEFETAEETRTNAQLAEEKKFKELADKEREKREAIEKSSAEKLRTRDVAIIRQELRSVARELGIIDPDDIKNIDIREMRVTDEGEVPGAKEAVEALKASKAHWFKSADAATVTTQRARTSAPAQSQPANTTADASTWDKPTLKARWDTIKL